jgi:hypothetical protein
VVPGREGVIDQGAGAGIGVIGLLEGTKISENIP